MQQMQLDNTFWQYALSTYGKPGAADKLLHLQDAFGLDINLLLLMSWLGSCRRRMNSDHLQPCLILAGDWQQSVMRPLRAVRRQLRERLGDEAVYQQSKALELAVEQQIIARLYQQVQAMPLPPGDTACESHNIACYIKKALPEVILSSLQPWLDFAG